MTATIHAAVRGRTPSLRRRRLLAAFGPAFTAGIAYVDPGNVATNFAAGSRFGYQLIWVVLLANAAAALVQSLAAKLGLATGADLAEVSRARCPRAVVVVLWLQAEFVAIATDLAEVIGGAIALQLLFGLPLPAGSCLTAGAAIALLRLRDRGCRPFELAIATLFAVIAGGFAFLAVRARPSASDLASGLVPDLGGHGALVLMAAMIGATIMPHALYVHSALTADRRLTRPTEGVRSALRAQRADLGVALGAAGLVNALMLVVGAAALGGGSDELPDVHAELIRALGGSAGFVFALALLTSGLASSGVGTFAGEVIMAGYLRRRVPRWVRRGVTLAPVLVLLATGVPATTALIVSQVVLAIGVPLALGALIVATSNHRIMGDLVNGARTTAAAIAITAAIVALDAVLACQA